MQMLPNYTRVHGTFFCVPIQSYAAVVPTMMVGSLGHANSAQMGAAPPGRARPLPNNLYEGVGNE